MTAISKALAPQLDELGRWSWPDCECVRMMRRAGLFRTVLTTWLEEQIEALVDLPVEVTQQAESPDALRQERLRRFRQAAFSLHVEEHFSRTKRDRDQIIYSMLRCKSRPRLEELSLAIREGELDFAAAAIRYSEGPESAQGGRIGPISPDAGHPELKVRLAKANEGDLIGPFAIGDVHVLLRLDMRITTRLDEALQTQLLQELYNAWLDRQLQRLEVGDSIEPPEYIPAL
jgi:parvulin-like peptidyl-prolyl isomerase